ncbi:MAG TPA: arylsulfatase [Flavisolibacter sp.]|nr:arylsulfatase [Flavisolibacter sp.]
MKKSTVFLLSFFVFCIALKAQTKKESLPNIIFILADDLGYGDIGPYGQQKIKTPHLDQLAKEGMRFTDFYAGSTVCAPSRASLMTGQHTGRTYIRGNGELPLRQQDSVLPQYLKQKGYVNGMVGKWGLGLENTTGVPEKKGWDFFVGHLHHVEGHYQQSDSVWKMNKGESKKLPVPKGTFLNELFTTAAIDFIQQNKKKPFFLYVSYTLPHAELVVPNKYLQQYQDDAGNSLFAPEKAQPAGQHYGVQPHPKAAYAAMVTSMDDYIGNILQQLKKLGLEKNTIVVFASDNGTHVEGGRRMQDAAEFFNSSGPLRGIKRDLYEGGIRIPFIVKWPGRVPADSTSNFIGAFWDVLPTFAAISKAKVSNTDGLSFLPALKGQAQTAQHEFLYWEFYENGFKQALRKGEWKAIRFYKNGKRDRTELYNLNEDLGEKIDLSKTYTDKVTELEALMDKAHRPSESKLFQIK